MSSALTIEDLDPASVEQAEEFLANWLKAEYPSMDLVPGRVLRDLLIRPAAMFHALNQTDIDRLRQSMSLKAIEADPALADEEIVDGVLSNYRVTRNTGQKSSGLVTIVLSDLLTTSVDAGTAFTANGLSFLTSSAYVGVTSQDAVTNDGQRLITQRVDGTYSFTVPVEAADVGTQYDLRRNTRMTASPAIPNMIDALATQDFAGGANSQTNEELIQQFKTGISPSVFSGRIQIEALCRGVVPGLEAISITGFGDAEMLRDRHNIFEVSQGGKADLWVRTAYPQTVALIKEATLVDAAQKLWQITIARDDAPGFYTIDGVLPTGADPTEQTLQITGETRGLDLSQAASEFVPDVSGLVEGAYSRYQTGIFQFVDPATDPLLPVGSKSEYQVFVNKPLYIADLQGKAVDRAARNPQADYLVRAAVPAFCALNLTVQYRDGSEMPDADAIKTEIVKRVNGLGFVPGRLPASIIHDAVHNVAGPDVIVVSPLDLICQIRKPSGETVLLRGPDDIAVPYLPAEGVTNRTVNFYLGAEQISITVEKIPVQPV
jgi:hypothetical protein